MFLGRRAGDSAKKTNPGSHDGLRPSVLPVNKSLPNIVDHPFPVLVDDVPKCLEIVHIRAPNAEPQILAFSAIPPAIPPNPAPFLGKNAGSHAGMILWHIVARFSDALELKIC